MTARHSVRPVLPIAASLLALASLTGCPGEGWTVAFEDLPGALISVTGTSARDVWAVGGDPGDGSGPFVLHFDGARWKRLRTGHSGDLWWVHAFPGGPVFAGGKDGLILRFQDGAFERMTTPGTGTVFGLWGTSPQDLWAVGGDGASNGFVWRFDGSTWSALSDVPARLREVSLFKVFGTSADEVWIVGGGGVTARWNGHALTEVVSATTRTLFTVHASAGRMAAVGGYGTGVILEHDGSAWVDVTPAKTKQLIGVYLTENGGYAVGVDGTVMRRTESGWEEEPTELDLDSSLHAVWVDPEGGVWAAGGQVLVFPLLHGVLLHRGKPIPGRSYDD